MSSNPAIAIMNSHNWNDAEILQQAENLSSAVNTIMNPQTPQEHRALAHQAVEEFKNASLKCARCGLLLFQNGTSQHARHLGLQLIEHTVREQWNNIDVAEKMYVKDSTMQLLATGVKDITKEEQHVKDGITRIFVEMIKREWPQNWPDMLSELEKLSQHGAVQRQLVLMIFLRIAEDVIVFQSVPQVRRKEILQGLTQKFELIMNYFMDTLIKALQKQDDPCELLVAQTLLDTLTGYIEWCPQQQLFQHDRILPQSLCQILSNSALAFGAVECLNLITSRKGLLKDRGNMLCFFEPSLLTPILSNIGSLINGELNFERYMLLKALSQLVSNMGVQLCAFWANEDMSMPSSLSSYMECVLMLYRLDSLLITCISDGTILNFLKHQFISKSPFFLKSFPALFSASKDNLKKPLAFDPMRNSMYDLSSKVDLEAPSEFCNFYMKYRSDISETVRRITNSDASHFLFITLGWLDELLLQPVSNSCDCELRIERSAEPVCSRLALEWEAVATVLDIVVGRLAEAATSDPAVISPCLLVIEKTLQMQSEILDFSVMSSQLSVISTLFLFVAHKLELVEKVLTRLIECVAVNEKEQSKVSANLCKHACALLIKLAKLHQKLLFPHFSRILQFGLGMNSNSVLMRTYVFDAIFILSCEVKNHDKQSEFLRDVLSPVTEIVSSPEIITAISQSANFMAFVGLDKAPVESKLDDPAHSKRGKIYFMTLMLVSVVRRVELPEDPQVLVDGGFLVDGVCRHPALQYLPLDFILCLVRLLQSIFSPELIKLRHPAWIPAYQVPQAKMKELLGGLLDEDHLPVKKSPIDSMQNFLQGTYQQLLQLLALCAIRVGHQFYSTIASSPATFTNTMLCDFHRLPDDRMQAFIHFFLKPYIASCPVKFFQPAVIPLLTQFSPFLHQFLSQRWEVIHCRSEECDENEAISQEMLQDHFTRLITKDYLEVLTNLFLTKSDLSPDDSAMDDDRREPQRVRVASELGSQILGMEGLMQTYVSFIFEVISWRDSTCCSRACMLATALFDQMQSSPLLASDDWCHLFLKVLQGIEKNGSFDPCLVVLIPLALSVFKLKSRHPNLRTLMLMIPGNSEQSLHNFESTFLSSGAGTSETSKRKTKLAFKNLVKGAIMENLGERFKKETATYNLPPLIRERRAKVNLQDFEKEEFGLCSLFQTDRNSASFL